MDALREFYNKHALADSGAMLSQYIWFALVAGPSPNFALTLRRGAKDPVCGMTVDRHAGKPTSTYGGKTFYFCGEHCRHTFNANPQEYA